MDDLLDQWLRDVAASGAAATVARYGGAIHHFLGWYRREERRALVLADLTPIALVGYRAALQATAACNTVNTHVAALRAWTRWLHGQGLLADNPAARLKLVARQAPTAPRALQPRQVHALLREAGRSGRYPRRNSAITMLLLQTGMRIGECAALTWADLECGEKTGRVTIRAGKGNKARTVPLNGSARQAVADYAAPLLGVAPTLKAVAGAWPAKPVAGSPSPSFWRSERGTMTLSAMERAIGGLLRAGAGRGLLPATATPHSLRHTFAVRYLATHPGDLVRLAHILGHRSLDATRIYLQPTEEELARRIEDLDLNAYG